MTTFERLQRDHKLIRSQLKTLRALSELQEGAWYALRQACFTLALTTREHCEREDGYVSSAFEAALSRGVALVKSDRSKERGILRTLHRLFVASDRQDVAAIRPVLLEQAAQLEAILDAEDRELLPALKMIFEADPGRDAELKETGRELQPTITLNALLKRYPHVEPVLEGMFIDCRLERSACLDELSRRHGMQFHALQKRLLPYLSRSGGAVAV